MRHGTSPFIVFPSPWSIRTLPRGQLDTIVREWYQHPNGQLPAYEWNFGDVNPPVVGWAAWRVLQIEAQTNR